MLFEHEHIFLEEMNDLLSLMIDHYLFDRYDDYVRDKEAITKFVEYVVCKNKEAMDEPRGKTGRTYRQASKYP